MKPREIDRLKSGELSQEDFDGAKILARADFLRETINSQNIIWRYGWQAVTGEKIYSIEEHMRSLMNVTADDVCRVAKKYFTKENLAVVLVGPVSEEAIKFSWK